MYSVKKIKGPHDIIAWQTNSRRVSQRGDFNTPDRPENKDSHQSKIFKEMKSSSRPTGLGYRTVNTSKKCHIMCIGCSWQNKEPVHVFTGTESHSYLFISSKK